MTFFALWYFPDVQAIFFSSARHADSSTHHNFRFKPKPHLSPVIYAK